MTMSQARAHFARALRRAERGESVEITRGGRPVAVIVSMDRYRESGRTSPAKAFDAFMEKVDRRRLSGPDPWGVRDRSPGRDFRW